MSNETKRDVFEYYLDIIKGTNTNWLVYPDAIALLAIMISMIGKVWLS